MSTPPSDIQHTPLTAVVLDALGAGFCEPQKAGEQVDLRTHVLVFRVDDETTFIAALDRRGVFPQVIESAINAHALKHVLVSVLSVEDETADAVQAASDWCSPGMAFSFDRKHSLS